MKKAKMVLLLAIAFAVASAFTTSSSSKKNMNTYVAVYDSETSFHWELLEGDFNECSSDFSRACSVQAESTPANDTKPEGYIQGEYIQ